MSYMLISDVTANTRTTTYIPLDEQDGPPTMLTTSTAMDGGNPSTSGGYYYTITRSY